MIEKLKKEDLLEYKKLIDSVFGNSNDLDIYNNYDENNDNYEVLVLKINNKIAGTVTMYKINLFTFSFQPTIELFNVAVLDDFRGQGVAKKLLEYIIEYAKENGFKSINLTCLENACNAHMLYERVGMERTTSIKFNMNIN